MKLILILCSFILLNGNQTENYYIIKVRGEITNITTGEVLKQGDSFSSTDQLKFENKRAMALAISDQKGRFRLKYKNANDIATRDLIANAKDVMVKTNKANYLTRSIVTNAPVTNLKTFFGEGEFTIIGNIVNVKLSKNKFENQSIVAKYEQKGKLVDKKLITEDYTLKLSRSTMGVRSVGEVKLYHVDIYQQVATQRAEEKITRLDVNFIDKNVIKDEFKTIIGVYKKKNYNKPQMKQFLMEYFTDFYGKTYTFYLSQMVDKVIEQNMD